MKYYRWYDGETGRDIVKMPEQCVQECSHAGDCDEDVRKWVDRVEWLAPAKDIRASLRSTGAWTPRELRDNEANRRRMLWVAAGDCRENPDDYIERT